MMKGHPVKITFVGDIFPANLPYNRNCGVASLDFKGNKREGYVKTIGKIISPDRLFIGNLESPILKEVNFSKEHQFAGHPDFLRMLKDAGINIVSLANNHILEWQKEGLHSTVSALMDLRIDYIGTVKEDGSSQIVLLVQNGLKLAFMSYNAIDNSKYEQGAINIFNKERIIEDIGKLNDQDYIFIILHWGDEYIHRPSKEQIKAAHDLVDAGAHFVICSHPHVVQPVEEYHGGLICYSLGNFVFDMSIPKSAKTGMIVDIDLSKNSFIHNERFIRLQNDFFPTLLKDDSKVRKLLKAQTKIMNRWQTMEYLEQYEREKKKKRFQKRITEKYLLLRNWRKYTPTIRRQFIHYYIDIFKHGKNKRIYDS